MENIKKYFPDLNASQLNLFAGLLPVYSSWNQKINVISRKDMDNFYTNHVLHSLAIGKVIKFSSSTHILDVGTGGGFPGIPLAILFPECRFVLVDSIEKKIKVVNEVIQELQLKNVEAIRGRAENVNNQFDFVISRAVTTLPVFAKWVHGKILKKSRNMIPNGILYLKGGDFSEELKELNARYKIIDIANFFAEDFFETKKVVHIFS